VNEQVLAPAVRVAGKITGPGTFTVRSATDPSQSWTVEWQSPKTHWCGCPKFAKDNRCRHSLAVFDAIALEWEKRRQSEKHERIAVR
jgi:hypothetical protein